MTDPLDGEKTSGNTRATSMLLVGEHLLQHRTPCLLIPFVMSAGFPLQQAPAFNAVRTSAMATTSDRDGTRRIA